MLSPMTAPPDAVRPADQDPESRQIARLGRREPAALEELIESHQPRVARLAHRLLGWNRADAADIVQDVFLRAWQHAPRFRGDSSLASWLTRITINRCRSLRRRKALDLRRLWTRAQRDPTPQDSGETPELVRHAVSRLPQHEREVVVLYYLEEMPAARIAEMLGISTGAVDVRLHRARAKLKATLGPHVGESFDAR